MLGELKASFPPHLYERFYDLKDLSYNMLNIAILVLSHFVFKLLQTFRCKSKIISFKKSH